MLQLERQKDILRLLQERKSMTVKELCAVLYASPATVRRDLAALEQIGLLQRMRLSFAASRRIISLV